MIIQNVDVVILAGGLGTRLRSVLEDVPKVLAPVNGRPFLDLILDSLKEWKQVTRVVLAIGYMSEKVIDRYKDNKKYPFEIDFSIEETLLGTGGAIKKALAQTGSDLVLALNGDSFIDVCFNDFYQYHMDAHADMTIVLKRVDASDRYGLVEMDIKKRIIAFKEKFLSDEQFGYINAGMYLFKRELFDDACQDQVISLEKELIPRLLSKNIYGHIGQGKFIDIGIPETLSRAGVYLKEFME
jgi:D-glycero-alpha-D-manno-heptose 1-phosphate guanylyltransferase